MASVIGSYGYTNRGGACVACTFLPSGSHRSVNRGLYRVQWWTTVYSDGTYEWQVAKDVAD